MVYKNVQEVYVDEDFGFVTIVTDKEIITIELKVRADIEFKTHSKNK